MSDLPGYTVAQFEEFSSAAQRRTARTRMALVIDTATGSRADADHFKQQLSQLEAVAHAD